MNAPDRGQRATRFYPVVRAAQTGSTNADVLAEAQRGVAEGFTLVADQQTAGKGRQGRTWVNAAESLLASVLLRPSDRLLPVITMVAGLAVAAAVDELTPSLPSTSIGLKWPNDVLIAANGEQKVAGILTEAVSANRRNTVVVGVGLNLRSPTRWPDDVSAVSVGDVEPQPATRSAALETVLAWLETELRRAEDNTAAVVDAYRQRCWTIDRNVSYSNHAGETIEGRAVGVDPTGALMVATDNGQCRLVSADVFHRKPSN